MDITGVLIEIRRRLNLSRPELSKLLGLPTNYVWLLENKQRKPSLHTCYKIKTFAKERAFFGVTFGMLRDELK